MRRNGFTLLEVILASTLTAFVAMVAVAGVRTVSRTREIINHASEASDALRYAAGKIDRDLSSVVRGSGAIFEGIAPDPSINLPASLRMRVYQTDPARRGGIESDLYEVEYALLHSDDRTFLVRRVCPIVGMETDPEETDGGMMTVLSESIMDFQIQYFDGTEWTDSWSDYTTLPQLVVISLAAADLADASAQNDAGKNPRILHRTIWMHFPGEPTLDQASVSQPQTSTDTETTGQGQNSAE